MNLWQLSRVLFVYHLLNAELLALPHSWCNGLTGNGKTRARNSSNSACPYICRFSVFSRFTWPSTGPLLQTYSTAFSTAARSFFSCFRFLSTAREVFAPDITPSVLRVDVRDQRAKCNKSNASARRERCDNCRMHCASKKALAQETSRFCSSSRRKGDTLAGTEG